MNYAQGIRKRAEARLQAAQEGCAIVRTRNDSGPSIEVLARLIMDKAMSPREGTPDELLEHRNEVVRLIRDLYSSDRSTQGLWAAAARRVELAREKLRCAEDTTPSSPGA